MDLDDLQRHGFNWLRVWATSPIFAEQSLAAQQAGVSIMDRSETASKVSRADPSTSANDACLINWMWKN